jgi:hypothetical protein
VRIEGIGLGLAVSGLSISGDFSFEQLTRPDGQRLMRLGMLNVTIALGDPASPLVRVINGTGKLLLSPAGVAGEIGGTLSLNIGGAVTFTGQIVAAINTTPAAVHQSFTAGTETVQLRCSWICRPVLIRGWKCAARTRRIRRP